MPRHDVFCVVVNAKTLLLFKRKQLRMSRLLVACHLTYTTLCSGVITFIAKIRNSQITGDMTSNGTSGEFEITGEVDAYGSNVVDLGGGDYIGESEGTLSRLAGTGGYTPPHKTSFAGCAGTWIWHKK